jgi:hypothetical protein
MARPLKIEISESEEYLVVPEEPGLSDRLRVNQGMSQKEAKQFT